MPDWLHALSAAAPLLMGCSAEEEILDHAWILEPADHSTFDAGEDVHLLATVYRDGERRDDLARVLSGSMVWYWNGQQVATGHDVVTSFLDECNGLLTVHWDYDLCDSAYVWVIVGTPYNVPNCLTGPDDPEECYEFYDM